VATANSHLNSEGHIYGVLPDKTLRFGGLNGGGGGVVTGETITTAAIFTIGSGYDATQSITFTFSSNPEPGTMILGGVGLLIGGAGGYRRRRKAKAKNQEEQAA
jgi:hypothetical protein